MTNQTTRSYRWLFWALALVGLCVDQGSKYQVFASLYPESPRSYGNVYPLIPDLFALDAQFTDQRETGDDLLANLRTGFSDRDRIPHVNHGALWGLGGKDRDNAESGDFNSFFAFISIVAALAIIVWNLRPSAGKDWYLSTALGLILGGTLGNLYDRIVFSGVRDFLHFYPFNFPVFNMADSCLVCGASMLLLQAFYLNHEPVQDGNPIATTEATTPGNESTAAVTEPQMPQVAEAK